MTDAKIRLRTLVEDNVSSVQMMSERLGVEMEEVVSLLNEMIGEGSIEGQVTPDGLRFYRSKVRVSEAPRVPVKDEGPAFLKYNTRPGRIMAILGFIAVIAGLGVSFIASESQSVFMLNVSMLLLLVGTIIMILGAYQVGRRPAPM